MSSRKSKSESWKQNTRNNNISREHHEIPIDLHAILSSLVHFQGRVRKFQEILKEIEVEDIAEIMEGCLHEKDYDDFFNTREKVFTLVRENIPPPPTVYIPRLISNRVKINPDIFKQNCSDTFVFKKGIIETFYLTELVRPNTISKFDIHLASLTSRFAFLDNEGDWENIRNLSTAPVHLISFEKDPPAFILEETSGAQPSEIIGNFILPRQVENVKLHISEEELIAKYQSDNNSSGVCICDTSGTGKSILLASLARKTRQKYPERIVAFISLSQFIANLQNPLQSTDLLTPSNALILIFQHISPSPLAKAILMKALSKTSIQLDLFFDGFDEIPRENINWAKELLRITALDRKNIKLYVTAKPENRHELETTLGLVAYDIVPISPADQINFFVTFCLQSGTAPRIYEEARLKEFASLCLRQRHCLPKRESTIMGNLLHCYLLAQLNLKNAQTYSDPGDGTNTTLIDMVQVAPKVFSSIYEIYSDFMEQRFHCEEMQSVNGKMKAFHVDQALKLLFPRDAADSFFLYEEAGNLRSPISEYVLSFGLLQVQCHGDSVFSDFVHRTFAEFLVAEFFTNFWTNQRTDDTRLLKVAVDSAMFLPLSVIVTETHKYGWLKNCQRFDSLFLPIHIWLYQFSYPVIVHFINAKLAEQQKSTIYSINPVVKNSFEKSVKSDQLYQLIVCCVSQGYVDLLCLIRQILSGVSREILEEHKNYLLQKSICVEVENRGKEEYEFVERSYFLLCLAAESSNVTMTEQVFQIFQECFSYNLSDLCRVIPVYMVTPLHLAIDKVDCELVAYYVDKISLEGRQLLSFCAHHSYGEPLELTQRRIAICQLFLYRNRNLVLEPGFIIYGGRKCTSFLVLVKQVHLDLLKFLILSGADIFVQRGIDGASIVTVAAEYMSSSDFQELIRFLIKDCKAIDVFIPNYTTYQYPLHSILRSGPTLESESIKMILDIPGISVNEKDGNGKTIIFYALHGNQSISVLEELVRCGAQYKKKDKLIERVLQSATENECSEMVRYLRSFGVSMNVRNKEGNTPILLAYRNLKVIKHLITENANIYALSKSGDSFLHLAASYMTAEDFQELICFLLTQYKAGDLFRLKNKMGRTPLHVRLVSRDIQGQVISLDSGGGGGRSTVENETIEMLLSISGIKINGVDKAGNNLILLAVQGRKSIATIRSLVDHGVDYRKCNKKGESALHLAVDSGGHVDAVRYFLSLPDYLKINQRDYVGQTALERAVEEWNKRNGCKALEEVIVMLREAEINAN